MSTEEDRAIAAAVDAHFSKGRELHGDRIPAAWASSPEMMRAAISAYEAAKAAPRPFLESEGRAIREGYPSKVHWIRQYRVRTGLSLKEALAAYETDKPMAPLPASDPEAGDSFFSWPSIKGLPDDLFSHQRAWRSALVAQRDSAKVEPPDIDDRAYWQHELDVFDRVSADLSAIAARNQGTSHGR